MHRRTLPSRQHIHTHTNVSHAFKERKKQFQCLDFSNCEDMHEGVFLMQRLRNRTLEYRSLSWRIHWDVKELICDFPFLRVFSCCVSFFPENGRLHKSTSFGAQHQVRRSTEMQWVLLTVPLRKSRIESRVSVCLLLSCVSVSRLSRGVVTYGPCAAVRRWTTLVLIKIGSDRENGKRERAERR